MKLENSSFDAFTLTYPRRLIGPKSMALGSLRRKVVIPPEFEEATLVFHFASLLTTEVGGILPNYEHKSDAR